MPERLSAKFFSASDLDPFNSRYPPGAPRSPMLLSEAELDEVTQFASTFAKCAEVVLGQELINARPHLRMFITMLRALGVVRVEESSGNVKVIGTGRLSKHLPEVCAIYVSQDLTLFDRWDYNATMPEDELSAIELVRQLEVRRLELARRAGHRPEPLASRPGAFAVFHARNQHDQDCYLFELNKDWRRLNFIGGKQEEVDGGDFQETVLREIHEELGISRERLSLMRLNSIPIEAYCLGGSIGILASYPCVLFGARVEGPLTTRVKDRWLTEEEIRYCMQLRDSPIMVNPTYLKFLLEGEPSRLSKTLVSTDERVHSTGIKDMLPSSEAIPRRWVRVLKQNKDLLAAVITLGGAVITLAVALLAVH